jgi:RimJ/RimL family protein N-acetyltransferase
MSRTGLAVLLMRRTCEALTASGYDEVVLWTLRDAGQARRFYEKVGFVLTGEARTDRVTDWARAGVDCPEVEYGTRFMNATSA